MSLIADREEWEAAVAARDDGEIDVTEVIESRKPWFMRGNPFTDDEDSTLQQESTSGNAGAAAQNQQPAQTQSAQPQPAAQPTQAQQSTAQPQPSAQPTQAQQSTAQTAQPVANEELSRRISEELDKMEGLRTSINQKMVDLTEDYILKGGDPADLGTSGGAQAPKQGSTGSQQSSQSSRQGSKDAKSDKDKQERNSEGGEAMAKPKLSEQELQELDAIIEQIMEKLKGVTPSLRDELMEALRTCAVASRKAKLSKQTRNEALDLFDRAEALLNKNAKHHKEENQKARDRRKIFGI